MLPRLILIACFAATPLLAETEDADPGGILNPSELTWESMLERAEQGETGMVICSTGYAITKKGEHDAARRLFENCARDGYTGTMTWMSQLDNNGLGGSYDPDAAAEWDRKAAELGDPVGKFNYGLDLMRGHGVARDESLGRKYVDDAARDGLEIAKRLQRADYDLDEVTPDADNWKYAPLF
ncbi:tetratricopeptide repeat protein [Actibacterium sp. 188UL27-1]|uniref:tetratricopeptide repeat protein n=1 Tax=Actibacterium sp. 188UL27-1 TaxID=2786961 RepID=UPI00195B5B02|nr:sel1 repeat family protein [Actibacterium sp. 188UL27-1]MBM7066407.1 sel1 repeat family protein [Actibacterium sp. 188UL27-1]